MSDTQVNNNSGSLISWKYLAISISLSIIGMGLVFYFTYTPDTLHYLKPKRLPGLFIAVAVALLKIWFSASKIRYIADYKISWMASLRIMLTWDFASAITPSTIGGAPLATYAMAREGVSLGKSSAIILYGVLLDQFWYAIAVPILLIGGVYMEVIPPEIGMVGAVTMILIYIGLIGYGVFLTYGLLINPKAIKSVVKAVFRLPGLRKQSEKINKEAENLEMYSHELRKKPASFVLYSFYLSTMAWLCRIAVPVIVVLSLLPAQEVLLIMRSLAMNLASLIIPTPGGSGGVEGLFAVFIGPVIDRIEFIGLAVFVWRFITYYVSIGLGVFATTWYMNNTVNGESDDLENGEPAHG